MLIFVLIRWMYVYILMISIYILGPQALSMYIRTIVCRIILRKTILQNIIWCKVILCKSVYERPFDVKNYASHFM